jgi:hypothetical protein
MDDLMQLSGLTRIGLMPAADGVSLPVTQFGSLFVVIEDLWHGEIGAVDIYAPFGTAGYDSPLRTIDVDGFGRITPTVNPGNVIGIFPTLGTLLNVQVPPSVGFRQIPYAYPWFYVRVQMSNLARYKALYLAKGYTQIWSLIQQLRALSAGQPGTEFPATPPVEATDRNAHWCLTQIDAIFGELPVSYMDWGPPSVPPTPSNPGGLPPITVEQIIQRLLSVVDNSTNDPTAEPPSLATTHPRPLSLRQAILAVTYG